MTKSPSGRRSRCLAGLSVTVHSQLANELTSHLTHLRRNEDECSPLTQLSARTQEDPLPPWLAVELAAEEAVEVVVVEAVSTSVSETVALPLGFAHAAPPIVVVVVLVLAPRGTCAGAHDLFLLTRRLALTLLSKFGLEVEFRAEVE